MIVILILIIIGLIGLYFYKHNSVSESKDDINNTDVNDMTQQLNQQINGQSVECLAGTYVKGNGCELCDPGYYSDTKNSKSCVPCPAGKYAPTYGSRWCINCAGSHEGSATCI